MKDYATLQREAASIRADMRKAADIVRDAKARYIKAKVKARSKKQAADKERMFADIAEYANKEAIQDAYGWASITLSEYDRLVDLWDMRERYDKESGQYKDRVIEMLEKAMSRIGDDYQDFLCDADDLARENERNQQGRWPKR